MHLTESIKNEISAEWESFEALTVSTLHSGNELLNTINGYLFEHSGKKLRPLLALCAASSLGKGINEDAVTCAAVSEIIHTATLLHDDVVDESDMRRGAATVRSLFSQGASVLMGDYWLSRAVSLLVKVGNMRIMELFSGTIGDLASGEILQMDKAEKLDTTLEDYLEIIRCKTASLFVSSIVSAAMAVGGGERQLEALREYAFHLGLLFQMRDDILDYSDSKTIGKDSDCDIAERKITIPLLCALDNALEEKGKILTLLSGIDVTDAFGEKNRSIIKQIKSFVLENGGIPSAQKKLEELSDNACKSIEILPENNFKGYLCAIPRILISEVCNYVLPNKP
ncbi:MAG: polyprenyl synthetase family protein [Alistipes sp.]|nr:polyprenyl synthetase family protein [Candidatus Minthomonas equi]